MTTPTLLEDRIRELVPESDRLQFLDIETLNLTGLGLEHCRIAIRRHFKPPVSPTNDPDHPLIALHYAWKDLEPWESQTEVHTVLEKYLLTK